MECREHASVIYLCHPSNDASFFLSSFLYFDIDESCGLETKRSGLAITHIDFLSQYLCIYVHKDVLYTKSINMTGIEVLYRWSYINEQKIYFNKQLDGTIVSRILIVTYLYSSYIYSTNLDILRLNT